MINHNMSDILIVMQHNYQLHKLGEALRDKPNKAHKETKCALRSYLIVHVG